MPEHKELALSAKRLQYIKNKQTKQQFYWDSPTMEQMFSAETTIPSQLKEPGNLTQPFPQKGWEKSVQNFKGTGFQTLEGGYSEPQTLQVDL